MMWVVQVEAAFLLACPEWDLMGHPLLHFQEVCKLIVKQNHYFTFLKIEVRRILFNFL